MVARAGGYYGASFMGAQGVKQVEPLYPTIFNVLVDVVVLHWVSVMVEVAEEWGDPGQECRHQNSLFYTDDGMVASSDPQFLQGYFITLVGLFNRVGLRTNVGKTVGMVCCPCQASGTQSEAEYGRRMTVEVPLLQDRQRGRVQCK